MPSSSAAAPPSGVDAAARAAADADNEAFHRAAQAEYEASKIRARKSAEKAVEDEEQMGRQFQLRPMSSFTMARTKWLWRGRVPIGEITLIGGKGGIGKSQILCMLAAWISNGRMKGEYLGTPRNVIYVANEDSTEATVLPRLVAAGADPGRVFRMTVDHLGEPGRIDLRRDIAAIAEQAAAVNAAAIMFDPLSSNLGVKSNSGDEIRPLFEALRRMADEQQLAVVGLGHLRKGASADFMEAFLGSSEIGNVIRAGMGVIRDDDDDQGGIVLSQVKNNLGRMDLPSYKLRILTAEIEDTYGRTFVTSMIDQANIEKTDQDASDMMREAMAFGESMTKVREAADFLLELLASKGGQMPRKDIINAARSEGVSQSTLDRARKRLGIETSRSSGFQPTTVWSLPAPQSSQSHQA